MRVAERTAKARLLLALPLELDLAARPMDGGVSINLDRYVTVSHIRRTPHLGTLATLNHGRAVS
jgi:hypothetical protein